MFCSTALILIRLQHGEGNNNAQGYRKYSQRQEVYIQLNHVKHSDIIIACMILTGMWRSHNS